MKSASKSICVLMIIAAIATPSSYAASFLYNDRGEITNAVIENLSVSWEYDSVGNRIRSEKPSVTNYYTVNNRNQYTSISNSLGAFTVLEYDADGNLTKDHRLNYRWDAENRLIVTWPTFFNNGGRVVNSSYDHLHRRVKKEVKQLVDFDSQYPSSPTNGRLELVYSTTFVYDRNRIIAETTQNADGTTNITTYIWGLDLSGSLDGAAGIGGLIGVSIDGTFYKACADATGNITAYIDTNGAVVAEYRYDPFGEIIQEAGVLKDLFKIRFSSKYLDVETSDYNFGRRFYDPWLGRWLNSDPIEEHGGINLYCFAANDPINNVDPLGEVVLVDDALAVAAIDAALMAAATYLATPDGQEKCRLTYDATVNACACACDSLRTVSNDAYKKAQKQLDVAITHLSYLGGGGHGKDPNDRWRNWNKWKSEIRTALENARKKAKGCTTKAKEETLKQIQKLEEQLEKISEKPRGGE